MIIKASAEKAPLLFQELKLDHSLSSGSQDVIPGPATSVSIPWNLLEMAVPRPHPRPPEASAAEQGPAA